MQALGQAPSGPAGGDAPCIPVPGADAFFGRQNIPDQRYCGLADLTSFGNEPNEPEHFSNDGNATAWWSWRATGPGVVTFFAASAKRAGLAVYRGSALSDLRLIRSHLSSTAGTPGQVELPTETGADYQIAVALAFPERGQVYLKVGYTPIPGNPDAIAGSDGFAAALPLAGANAVGVVNNRRLSVEPHEPRPSNNLSGKTAWWRWTAPSMGRFAVTAESAEFRAAVGVYTGSSSFTGLQLVGSSVSSTAGVPAEATFTALQGVEYRIVIDTVFADAGNLTMRLRPRP